MLVVLGQLMNQPVQGKQLSQPFTASQLDLLALVPYPNPGEDAGSRTASFFPAPTAPWAYRISSLP